MNKITRIFTGPDGQSHFDEIEIPIGEKPGIGHQSDTISATGMFFRGKKGSLESDWHRVSARQMVILLEGELEVEMGNGAKRRFTAGDVFLCEDMTGQGHKVRGVDRKTVVVQLS